MTSTYFQAVRSATGTRFWINNPTIEELHLALDQGAASCTTNPAYCSRLLQEEPEYIRGIIDAAAVKEHDIDACALEVYRQVSLRLMNALASRYHSSGGMEGFVTIQDDPRRDEDAGYIFRSAEVNRKLGPNCMAKIPVIHGGIDALASCVEAGIPVCATEVFALSQALEVAEVCRKAAAGLQKPAPVYITHISGIFDEYLKKTAAREGIDIAPEIIDQAGIAVARRQYALLEERGYRVILLGGGARGNHHFTGLVGAEAHITINWSTAVDIMKAGTEVKDVIRTPVPRRVVDQLREAFVDFRRAYDEGGLAVEEYAGYGPVQLFRNVFLKGWYQLLAEIAARRQALAI